MSDRQLILATSAQRPEYMRDFLTCIASPSGHRVAFAYQKRWFAPTLLEAGLVGHKALIVFCDAVQSHSEFGFLPVRHVVIEEIVPPSTRRLRDDNHVTVLFRLESFVAVTDTERPDLKEWIASIGRLDHRPRPIGVPNPLDPFFVFEHEQLDESLPEPERPSHQEAWRGLSEELGKCASLADAFFFQVGALRNAAAGGSDGGLKGKAVGSVRSVYPLKPSAEYELPIGAYSRSGQTPYSQAIDVASSSEQLKVQALTQSSAGRASEAVLVLRAGEVKRAQIATLIIQGSKGFEHLVPRVEVAAQIKPNYWLAVVLLIAIALGVVLGGLPKDAFGLADGWLYALKGLGGLIVGGATLWANGRLTGIGK